MEKSKELKLNISELFGPTIQGEGIFTGVPSVFLRLNGCNLCCSFGNPDDGISRSLCDTPYTSIEPDSPTLVTIDSLVEDTLGHLLKYSKTSTILPDLVITGGEPLLQQKALIVFLNKLKEALWDESQEENLRITIETNGTIEPLPELFNVGGIFWSISPKLKASECFEGTTIDEKRQKNHKRSRINIKALSSMVLDRNCQLKFVYSGGSECIKEINDLLSQISRETWVAPDVLNIDELVLLMPEGSSNEQLSKTSEATVQAAIENSWRFSDRNHIRIWNTKRKV